MYYNEIKSLKHSDKSTVDLVQEKDSGRIFIRKILKGQHPIYSILQECKHPCLPDLYEVAVTDDRTTIFEEYIEGDMAGSEELSEKQFLSVVKDLCSVLEYLHGKGIIHRDIKPSNIILARDGHIRLIDFDAARMPKDDLEQDTRLLGTRGYAPPEQYGFAQTDERADIYSMGVTLGQLMGDKVFRPRYKRIIRKCTDLDPDKRYQSVCQVRNAFFHVKRRVLYAAAAMLAGIVAVCGLSWYQSEFHGDMKSGTSELTMLPAPENPHWDVETGIALWGHVEDSGMQEDEEEYAWRVYYREDMSAPPEPDDSGWISEGGMRGNRAVQSESFFRMNIGGLFSENGFYYFAVSAEGDGIHYTDSPYVVSDAFEYTGEDAPFLPIPTGLSWRMYEDSEGEGRLYYATWDNLDDYEDTDCFNVTVYDKAGNYIMNNIWDAKYIKKVGYNGIRVRPEFLAESDNAYRFTVEVYSSRPNEYRSVVVPDPVPEEAFSPWLYR